MSKTIELVCGGVIGFSCGPSRTVRIALHDPPRFVERLLAHDEAREIAAELLRRAGGPAPDANAPDLNAALFRAREVLAALHHRGGLGLDVHENLVREIEAADKALRFPWSKGVVAAPPRSEAPPDTGEDFRARMEEAIKRQAAHCPHTTHGQRLCAGCAALAVAREARRQPDGTLAGPRSEAGRETPRRCWYCDETPDVPAIPNTCACRCHTPGHPPCEDIRGRETSGADAEIDRLRGEAADLAKASNDPDVPSREVIRHDLRQIEEKIDALLMERIARMP